MKKIRVGIFGFGKTGKAVVNEFLNDELFVVEWVVRKNLKDHLKYASRLLGYEFDAGKIFSFDDIDNKFFLERPVDIFVDFSDAQGVHLYAESAEHGIPIVSAISNYKEEELNILRALTKSIPVLYSPNITLGVNVLMITAQILQKIAPHAQVEIVEEHFKDKKEVSGTAIKIAKVLNLNTDEHVHSIRVGGIISRHEIIFGMPNQTIRLTHENINREAYGQGAIFAVKFLIGQSPGMYSMETIIAEMFKDNIPVY